MTATGKAMLAFQPQQFIDNYIKNVSFSPRPPYSIVTAQQLLENLEGSGGMAMPVTPMKAS